MKCFLWQYFHTVFVFNNIITLTLVSSVYSVDPPVEQRAASLLSLLVYYCSDSVLSGVRGLISELNSEQHSLPLQYCSYTACREKEEKQLKSIINSHVLERFVIETMSQYSSPSLQ